MERNSTELLGLLENKDGKRESFRVRDKSKAGKQRKDRTGQPRKLVDPGAPARGGDHGRDISISLSFSSHLARKGSVWDWISFIIDSSKKSYFVVNFILKIWTPKTKRSVLVPEFFLTKLNIERILAVLETNPCSARNLLESRENAQQQRKINLTRGSFRIFSFLGRIGSKLLASLWRWSWCHSSIG